MRVPLRITKNICQKKIKTIIATPCMKWYNTGVAREHNYNTKEKAMNIQELVELIKNIKGATPVGMDYESPVKMLKTGNPFADRTVTKFQSVSGMIGVNYEAGVNRQLEREGKDPVFEAQARKWGEHVSSAIVVSEKGDYSLILQAVNKPQNVQYYMDGQPIEKSVIENFLPVRKPSANQGTDKPVMNQTFRLDRVKAIRIKNQEIILK